MIRFLTKEDSENADLIHKLVDQINLNYTLTEAEFWKEGVLRTQAPEFIQEILNYHVIAYLDQGEIVGSMNFQIRGETAKFSMLSVNGAQHGKGIGNALYQFMEDFLIRENVQSIQLELLVPRNYISSNKNWIFEWYQKKGFKKGKTYRTEDLYFFPSHNLKIESDFIEMTKDF